MLDRLKTPEGRAILSTVIGIGLAVLFRATCKNGICVVVKGPDNAKVEGNVFRLGSSCYNYTRFATLCKTK
jgi:hypothetical protein